MDLRENVSFDSFIDPGHTNGNIAVERGTKEQIDDAGYKGWLPRGGIALGLRF